MKYEELPEPKIPGTFLFCRVCGEKYSATRGDYFHSLEKPATCCNGVLQLCEEQRRIVKVRM